MNQQERVLAAAAEDVVTPVDRNLRIADFINEAAVDEPVAHVVSVRGDEHADAAIKFACLVSNAEHESRCTPAEFARCIRMSDAQAFNEFCVIYGWLELRFDGGDDRVPSPCAIKSFHKRFGGDQRRDPIEHLRYQLKYVSTGGFDGVPAPAEWLTKVQEYIARHSGRSTAGLADSKGLPQIPQPQQTVRC
ncbi:MULTISPECIES: hypothetical protein [Burkholderia cepacia complex]|uniref:hypothetical protein n=1 Tax=Burkholderia cepacia complex TaxID=87882 RepID=UPI00158E598D|nr:MULTISPECIES: hypothetical protein [Burkholderia cepacia complex]